jgi:hypothetical protein
MASSAICGLAGGLHEVIDPMALKTIRVRIKSVDDALDDAIGVMRAIEAKRKVGRQHGE